MANSTIATIQKEFSMNMLTLLGESKGAKLAEFCERETGIEAGSHTFYRIGSATAQATLNNYVDAPVNGGGDTISLEVTPVVRYATIVLSYTQLVQTKLDLKSRFMYTFVNTLNNAEDAVVISAIEANANVSTAGNSAEAISSDDNFNELMETIAYVKALAMGNTEHGYDVAVALSRKDWANLFKSTKFTNSDFERISDVGYMLAGGLLVPCESVSQGTTYIIPAKTICFASFKDGDMAEIEKLAGKDSYSVVARKSFGANIFDEEAPFIYKFSSLVV